MIGAEVGHVSDSFILGVIKESAYKPSEGSNTPSVMEVSQAKVKK